MLQYSIYAELLSGRVDLNYFISKINEPNFDLNVKDVNGFTLIEYFNYFDKLSCDKLHYLLRRGVDINVCYRGYNNKHLTLFQHFIEDCCSCFGGDFHIFVKSFVIMSLDHGLNIYHANPRGITNIKYLIDKIITKKNNKCYCNNRSHHDPIWGLLHEFCSKCLTGKYLTVILDEIHSFNNRKTTFFELMLPIIKKCRRSNRRQRIK